MASDKIFCRSLSLYGLDKMGIGSWLCRIACERCNLWAKIGGLLRLQRR